MRSARGALLQGDNEFRYRGPTLRHRTSRLLARPGTSSIAHVADATNGPLPPHWPNCLSNPLHEPLDGLPGPVNNPMAALNLCHCFPLHCHMSPSLYMEAKSAPALSCCFPVCFMNSTSGFVRKNNDSLMHLPEPSPDCDRDTAWGTCGTQLVTGRSRPILLLFSYLNNESNMSYG